MRVLTLKAYTIALAALITGGCVVDATASNEDPADSIRDLDEISEDDGLDSKALPTTNGLPVPNGLNTFNGFSAKNGLAAANGLTVSNGLSVSNGITEINGLATSNGIATTNGLLNAKTGMLRADGSGLEVASYLVRCALRSGQVIKAPYAGEQAKVAKVNLAYKNGMVELKGELGLAPEWATGTCSSVCQERVSSAMIALMNLGNKGVGTSRPVQLSAAWDRNPLGPGHSADYPIMEGVYFGNIFLNPPKAYAVSGFDHTWSIRGLQNRTITSAGDQLMLRSCQDVSTNGVSDIDAKLRQCDEVQHVGTMMPADKSWREVSTDRTKYGKCSLVSADTNNQYRATARACSGPGSTAQSWIYPITVWRKLKTESPCSAAQPCNHFVTTTWVAGQPL